MQLPFRQINIHIPVCIEEIPVNIIFQISEIGAVQHVMSIDDSDGIGKILCIDHAGIDRSRQSSYAFEGHVQVIILFLGGTLHDRIIDLCAGDLDESISIRVDGP